MTVNCNLRIKQLSILLLMTITACMPRYNSLPTIEPTTTPFYPATNTPTFTPTIFPTVTQIPTTPTATPPPLPAIPEEYLPYTIAHLHRRAYGEGQIEVVEMMEEPQGFSRYIIRYPSDGLDIYGLINLPKGEGPFPIIIMLHGYSPTRPSTITGYASDIADDFAINGYFVIHPNLRGYPPSDNGDNRYRVGLAIDTLNLIALTKDQAGKPGLLETADPVRIGLWGQSLGGGVALRVATVSSDIKAVVLYSAISGDELKNAGLFYGISKNETYLDEMETPPEIMAYISPLNYFDKINASVKLYHSLDDDVVPAAWAIENCDEMKANAIDIDCFYYIGADHTFSSGFNTDFRTTMLDFFESKLKMP